MADSKLGLPKPQASRNLVGPVLKKRVRATLECDSLLLRAFGIFPGPGPGRVPARWDSGVKTRSTPCSQALPCLGYRRNCWRGHLLHF